MAFILPDVRPDTAQLQHPAVSEYTIKMYASRYPSIKFVGTDTWKLPEEHGKVGVLVECGCGKVVFRRTSDLHTFVGCIVCKGAVRATTGAEKKLARAQALLEALETLKAEAKKKAEGGDATVTV